MFKIHTISVLPIPSAAPQLSMLHLGLRIGNETRSSVPGRVGWLGVMRFGS